MSASLLVAADTLCAMRRRRQLLAGVLLCLGAAGSLLIAAARQDSAPRAAARPGPVRPPGPRARLEQQLAAKRADLRKAVESARRQRDYAHVELGRFRDFHARVLEQAKIPGLTLGSRPLSPDEIASLPGQFKADEREREAIFRRGRELDRDTSRKREAEIEVLKAERARLGTQPDAENRIEEPPPAAAGADAEKPPLVDQMAEGSAKLSLTAISFGGGLLALVLFCSGIASEIDDRTVRMLLSRPLSRADFLLGRCLGAALVLGAYWTLADATLCACGAVHWIAASALGYVPWLGFCGSLLLGTLGLVLSLFIRPSLAGVLTWWVSTTSFRWLPPVYAIVPSFQPFNAAVTGEPIGGWDTVFASLYAVDVIAILIGLALYRFSRLDLA